MTVDQFIKRAFDIVVSCVMLVVLAPVMLIVAIVIMVTMGRPVLFFQQRPGLHQRVFAMVKFRTMLEATETGGRGLSDGERLTALGRRLRATSLDELPVLWNVLKGDMSLVGPRPLLVRYLDVYSPFQARRHEVKPGITGWAQVNGRNSLSWDEKFQLDVWYVDHRSLWLDLRILFLTLVTVLRRDGISHDGHQTMPMFEGSDPVEEDSSS
jgi:sugar transferase EpsL